MSRRSFLQSALYTTAALPLLSRVANAESASPKRRFDGKVVLITGATSGIGEATAKAFAVEGAKVFFNGLKEDEGRRVEEEIKAAGGEATFFKSDIRIEKEVEAFVKKCLSKYSRIDVAFNNAGIGAFDVHLPADIPATFFEDVMRTNVIGTQLCMKYEIPAMLKQGGGVILNMASLNAHRVTSYQAAYSASKAAVVSLSASASAAYSKKNIRINSLSPGTIATPKVLQVMKDSKIRPHNSLERLISLDEVVKAVMALASDETSSFIGSDIDLSFGEKVLA
jgi:NAD(P)-dependent dehydrogenase (short-subunit alcohol dehydrogenase family)